MCVWRLCVCVGEHGCGECGAGVSGGGGNWGGICARGCVGVCVGERGAVLRDATAHSRHASQAPRQRQPRAQHPASRASLTCAAPPEQVLQLGGNLNNAWVLLPDIPTYLQGLVRAGGRPPRSCLQALARGPCQHLGRPGQGPHRLRPPCARVRPQWEKQLGRCKSRVAPLHVAVVGKKYDTVRALLDLGADPNLAGGEV